MRRSRLRRRRPLLRRMMMSDCLLITVFKGWRMWRESGGKGFDEGSKGIADYIVFCMFRFCLFFYLEKGKLPHY